MRWKQSTRYSEIPRSERRGEGHEHPGEEHNIPQFSRRTKSSCTKNNGKCLLCVQCKVMRAMSRYPRSCKHLFHPIRQHSDCKVCLGSQIVANMGFRHVLRWPSSMVYIDLESLDLARSIQTQRPLTTIVARLQILNRRTSAFFRTCRWAFLVYVVKKSNDLTSLCFLKLSILCANGFPSSISHRW